MSNLRLTISRPSDSKGKEVIRISLLDITSGANIEVEMPLDGFSRAITGLAREPVNQTYAIHLDKWGRKAVREQVAVSAHGVIYDDKRDAWCREQQEANCPEGFEFLYGAFNNMQQYNMTFIRWEASDE